jgi:microcystin-dependent protein
VLSAGEVTWNAPELRIPDTTLLEFLIITNSEDGASRSVRCQFQPPSLATWNINAYSFIYIELSRSNLESGSTVTLTDGISAAGTTGRRIRASTTLPRISDLNDGNPESTLAIPLVYKSGTNIWWVPSGMLWQTGTVSEVGNTTKIVNIPIGTIIGIHIDGTTDVSTINQAYVDANMNGWWLCDAATQPTITYAGSPMFGQPTPPLNNPVSATVGRERGRFLRGGTKSGGTAGSDLVKLTSNNMPSHRHALNLNTHQSHSHNIHNILHDKDSTQIVLNTGGSQSGSSFSIIDSDDTNQGRFYFTEDSYHNHTVSTATAATAHENIPQYKSVVYLFKVI